MFKLITALLLVAIVAAIEASDCNCPEEGNNSPVCGTDGKTYFNRDNLLCHKECNKSQLRVASNHACTCICPNSRVQVMEFTCTSDGLPVCTSDGKTYVNPGAVKCHNQCYNENIKVLSYLPCHKHDKERDM